MESFRTETQLLATIHTLAYEARKVGDTEAVEECVHYAKIVISGEWPEGFIAYDMHRYLKQLSAELFPPVTA